MYPEIHIRLVSLHSQFLTIMHSYLSLFKIYRSSQSCRYKFNICKYVLIFLLLQIFSNLHTVLLYCTWSKSCIHVLGIHILIYIYIYSSCNMNPCIHVFWSVSYTLSFTYPISPPIHTVCYTNVYSIYNRIHISQLFIITLYYIFIYHHYSLLYTYIYAYMPFIYSSLSLDITSPYPVGIPT